MGSGINCCSSTNTQHYKGGMPTIRVKEDRRYTIQQTIQGNDSKQALHKFRMKNMMSSIIIRNPKQQDLELDTSDEENNYKKNNPDGKKKRKYKKYEIKVQDDVIKSCKLGIDFQFQNLISHLPKKQQYLNLRKERMEKWHKMTIHGLDQQIAHKVVKSGDERDIRQSGLYNQSLGQDPQNIKKIEFTNYAKIGLMNFFNTNPEKFLSRLAKGPPPQYRWLAWSMIAQKINPKVKGDYEKFLRIGRLPENPSGNDIKKDLSRTFPNNQYFKEEGASGGYGQAQLQNILEAYSVYHPEVGYCQSMNFVAGFSLMISGGKEKQAFWFFNAILEKSKGAIEFDGLSGFYKSDFPLLMQYLGVFKELFAEFIPDLSKHFEYEMVPDQMWIHKWFMTCFLYSYPIGLCIRIWDNILAFGTRFIFNVTLAILRLLRAQLLELEFGDINEFFKALKDDGHLEQQLLPPYEQIIEAAQKIYIPDQKMNYLFAKYKPQPMPVMPVVENVIPDTRQLIIVNQPSIAKSIKESEPEDKVEADVDDQISQEQTTYRKKGKKKKKKKKQGASIIDIQDQQIVHLSEAVKRLEDKDLKLEDMEPVNEHNTEQHNHGGGNTQDQQSGSGETQVQNKLSSGGQANPGSSVYASIKLPMTIVTYPNLNRRRKKTEGTGSSGRASVSPHESSHITMTHGHTESFAQNSGDYVLQRESMIFKTIQLRSHEEEKVERKRSYPANDSGGYIGDLQGSSDKISLNQIRVGNRYRNRSQLSNQSGGSASNTYGQEQTQDNHSGGSKPISKTELNPLGSMVLNQSIEMISKNRTMNQNNDIIGEVSQEDQSQHTNEMILRHSDEEHSDIENQDFSVYLNKDKGFKTNQNRIISVMQNIKQHESSKSSKHSMKFSNPVSSNQVSSNQASQQVSSASQNASRHQSSREPSQYPSRNPSPSRSKKHDAVFSDEEADVSMERNTVTAKMIGTINKRKHKPQIIINKLCSHQSEPEKEIIHVESIYSETSSPDEHMKTIKVKIQGSIRQAGLRNISSPIIKKRPQGKIYNKSSDLKTKSVRHLTKSDMIGASKQQSGQNSNKLISSMTGPFELKEHSQVNFYPKTSELQDKQNSYRRKK